MGDLIQTEKCDPTLVYEYDLKSSDRLFDLAGVKFGQYRFVDCASLLDAEIIKVYAYNELPSVPPYTAVSYIWGGKKADSEDGTFKVKGNDTRKDERGLAGDPISIQILKDACSAAKRHNSNLLWLDRLCMNKSDKEDDDWQTMQMYEIYKASKSCIVFPGGLWTSTSLNEVTGWIDRGWTLQEAVAPPEVEVMFEWPWKMQVDGLDAQPSLYGQSHSGHITEIAPGRCAMASLLLLLDCTISGTLELIGDNIGDIPRNHTVTMFGTTTPGMDITADFRHVLPNVAALAVILKHRERNPDRYYHSIWKSTMMRSTRDAVDMVFSVMGLFGVKLNPAEYPDKHDCVKPAIKLVQGILGPKGAKATWLGASFFSPPCPHLSTFPSFPKIFPLDTKRDGVRPTVAIPNIGRIQAPLLMLNEHPHFDRLKITPSGTMDEEGYLAITASAAPVSTSQGNSSHGSGYTLKAINGTTWVSSGESPDEAEAFAVLLGCFKAYSPFANKNPDYDAASVRGFIIVREPGDPEKFYLDSYFMLNRNVLRWARRWEAHNFKVGGRHVLGAKVAYEESLPDLDISKYISNNLTLLQPNVMPPVIRSESAPNVGPGPPPTHGVANIAATWVPKWVPKWASQEVSTVSSAMGNLFSDVMKFEDQANYSLPPSDSLPVQGDPWQEEARWTSEALDELRDGLMEGGWSE